MAATLAAAMFSSHWMTCKNPPATCQECIKEENEKRIQTATAMAILLKIESYLAILIDGRTSTVFNPLLKPTHIKSEFKPQEKINK